MTYLIFHAICRPHALSEKIELKGRPSHKNLLKGHTELAKVMGEQGCEDFSKTVSTVHRDRDYLHA